MTRFALKGLASRKLRSLLTAFAIVLGVAMVSGTYVLTDTIQKAFDEIFSSSYDNTDAVVSGRKLVDYSQTGKATVAPDVLDQIRALPDVEAAAGTLLDFSGDTDQAKLLDKSGEPIENGNPTFGFGIDRDAGRFNPFSLTEGRWAARDGEVAIDKDTASTYHYTLGQRIGLAAQGPVEYFKVVGIIKFGELNSLGGATIAVFDVKTAQRIHRKTGYDAITVAARDGVSQDQLVDEIAPLLPDTAVVRSGEDQAKEDGRGVGGFLSIFQYILLGFAGIALFVGSFVIFNTISITVAQRTKELATLRTLGASRRQVMRSVVVEALALGVLASLVGLASGIGLAQGLTAAFKAMDFDLPRTSIVFQPGHALIAVTLGIVVTFLASFVPAIRATHVEPIFAVREGGNVVRPLKKRGTIAGLIVVAASVASLAYGLLGSVPLAPRLAMLVGGTLVLFIGVAMIAPRLVKPLSSVLGRAAGVRAGVAGQLARENAVRNPSRTASTAAALGVGLTLVTFVSVFGTAMLKSDERAVQQQVNTEYVVTPSAGWGTITRDAGQALESAQGVTLTSSVRVDRAAVDNKSIDVSGVDPATIAKAYHFDWVEGDDATATAIDGNGAIVRKSFADDEHLKVGDSFTLSTPAGKNVRAVVRGVYDPNEFDALLGHVVISQQAFDAGFPRPADGYTFANATSKQALETALGRFPDAHVQTEAEFVDDRGSDLRSIMSIFYVMLGLSVIVSLFGMVNTLVLAVFERTRELGMLRAIGMTRRQVRRMIRREAVTTALIGAGIGMPLGIGLAALVVNALSKYDVHFSLPTTTLAEFVVVAVFAGLAAAAFPARRASRLNVLDALQYE